MRSITAPAATIASKRAQAMPSRCTFGATWRASKALPRRRPGHAAQAEHAVKAAHQAAPAQALEIAGAALIDTSNRLMPMPNTTIKASSTA